MMSAKPFPRVDISSLVLPDQSACWVRQDYDRKIQPLRFVHRHQSHALSIMFEQRRLPSVTSARFVFEKIDKRTERRRRRHLKPPREIDNSSDVRENPLTSRAESETRVRPCGFEELVDRCRNALVIATSMKGADDVQRSRYDFSVTLDRTAKWIRFRRSFPV